MHNKIIKIKKFLYPIRDESPFIIILFAIGILFPFYTDNYFYIEVAKTAAIYAIFVISWDILSGYTHEINLGYAFFVGGAGYLSALFNVYLSLPVFASILFASFSAGIFGILIGYLTLRSKGPYFAMVTLVFASILFTSSFIFTGVTGGEEGISGLDCLTDDPLKDFLIIWLVLLVSYFILRIYSRSRHGIILKAIRADEDATKSAGINTSFYKIEAFALSATLGGAGGGLFAHAQMHIGPTMLSAEISIIVLLMTTIGGMGSIVGPFWVAIILSIFNEWLRIVEEYRLVLYTGILILLLYLSPDGLINSKFIKNSRITSYLFKGKTNSDEYFGS